MVNDAKYQLALFLLTYAIDAVNNVTLEGLPFILDRLLVAAAVLQEVSDASRQGEAFTRSHPYHLPGPVGSVPGRGSSPITVHADSLFKNNALAWMRLAHIVPVCMKFRNPMQPLLESLAVSGSEDPALIDAESVRGVLASGEAALAMLQRARVNMVAFLEESSTDADAAAFHKAIQGIESVLQAGPDQWKVEVESQGSE